MSQSFNTKNIGIIEIKKVAIYREPVFNGAVKLRVCFFGTRNWDNKTIKQL